jgi:hypothetical protein
LTYRATAGLEHSDAGTTAPEFPGPTGRRRAGADRDALLKALFPNGIPPKEEIIRAANSWLDDAERLARMR